VLVPVVGLVVAVDVVAAAPPCVVEVVVALGAVDACGVAGGLDVVDGSDGDAVAAAAVVVIAAVVDGLGAWVQKAAEDYDIVGVGGDR